MNNNLTTMYIVRHGETEWNAKKLIQGHKDSPLTANGISQAKVVAKILKNEKFDFVFSSDLLRAKKTADLIAKEKKLAVETTELLRERAFGEFEGKSFEKLKKSYEVVFKALSNEERMKYKHNPDIESDEEVTTRLITFLRETAITYPKKTILVVTHGGIIRTLLIHLGLTTYENFTNVEIGNASYIKLLTDGVDFFVNETKGITNLDN